MMRGPRNSLERKMIKEGARGSTDLRPVHCVGPVRKERVAILLRHVDESLK